MFYTVPRRIPAGQIRDPRIAMVVPRSPADPVQESISRELLAIKEAKERYVTRQDPETLALRGSFEEQESSLLGELARREARSYSQGRVYTQSATIVRPSEIFVEESVSSWVERLVHTIFQQAYPGLLFDNSEFPETLTSEGIGTIYRGVFQGDRDAVETVAAFGPALGLTTREAPSLFDASQCRTVEIIEGELRSRGGEMPAQEALRLLSLNHGLNRALALLYVLAFVRQAHAEVELTPEHSVQRRDGGLFPSDRVSWDLVQELLFAQSMADQLGVIRARPSLDWNAVLPYAGLLVEGLEPAIGEAEIAEQERRLLGALDEMSARIEGFREAVKALAAGLQMDASTVVVALNRLQVLCSATGYRGFHTVAVDSFGGPSGLSQALDLHVRLEQLSALVPSITQARLYLDEMTFGRDNQDLSVKRDSLIGRMGLDSLMGNPSLWGSVEEGVQQLRREYAVTYVSHHARYHQQAIESISRLERLKPQVEALARFNEVPEFGEPVGTDVSKRFDELMTSIRSCTASEDELSLDAAPVCQECLLSLDEEFPRREAASVSLDVERAMRSYNRRLSSEGVRRILAHPTKEQLSKFINLVQVSDLMALANILDEEVLEFLRSFVRRG